MRPPARDTLSPEQAAILEVNARLARIEQCLSALLPAQQPLSVSEFAQRVGRARSTVHRWIASGELQQKGGLIPASELGRYAADGVFLTPRG